MYMKEGKFIFPPGWFRRLLLGIRGIALFRYDRGALTQALTAALCDMKLSSSSVRLCIPAFEGHHGEVYIFKTPHHPDYKIDGHETLVKIGQATAAAPSFFCAVDSGGYRFVDGGIWANNPIMIGIIDALACYEIEPTQIEVLSIGCGRRPLRVGPVKAIGGLLFWSNVIVAAMDAQSQNAMGQARLILGPENVVRIEPATVMPIGLDDWVRASAELPLEAMRAAGQYGPEVQRFLSQPRTRADFYWPPGRVPSPL
jgi:patatin-like phospholipase/acyl hydrolase